MSEPKRVLLIDDGNDRLRARLSGCGYQVVNCATREQAADVLAQGYRPHVIVLGTSGDATHAESLAALRAVDSETPVVLLSDTPDSQAADFLRRYGPVAGVAREQADERLEATVVRLLDRPVDNADDSFVVGSDAMRTVFGLVRQVADTDVPVLITGESGVGKEVVARRLHSLSSRATASFVKVNCAALPDPLLESELFGYERGAFTGAERDRQGKFELADGGTVFLDEIGEIAEATQAKLLQVLQDDAYFRLGGDREVTVDARVVASTNRDLEQSIAEGGFRSDLFYRLNVVRLEVPPLRARREEIPMLVRFFLRRYEGEYGRSVGSLDETTLTELARYSWPGNVRELQNVVRRMVVLQDVETSLAPLRTANAAPGPQIDIDALIGDRSAIPPLKEVSKLAALEVEGELIRRALEQTGWNRRRAAELLQISYKALLYKIRDCGITAA